MPLSALINCYKVRKP